jgi:DNA-binding FadR family transcriptional regulator
VAGRRLRDAILRGALVPGEKIVEEQLCADFGISRAPIDILHLLALRHVLERHAATAPSCLRCRPTTRRSSSPPSKTADTCTI